MPTNRFDRTAYDAGPQESDPTAETANGHGPAALRRLQAQLEELSSHAQLYAAARKDAITAGIRRGVLWGVVGAAAFFILITMLITAAVLAIVGLAQLVGALLDDQIWAGNLIVGFGLLALCAVGLLSAAMILQSRFRKQTVKKYDKRHLAERKRFGHDAEQQGQAAERN